MSRAISCIEELPSWRSLFSRGSTLGAEGRCFTSRMICSGVNRPISRIGVARLMFLAVNIIGCRGENLSRPGRLGSHTLRVAACADELAQLDPTRFTKD